MRSLSLLTSIGVVQAAVMGRRDITISQSVRDPTNSQSIGRVNELTKVLADTTIWLSGSSTHNFLGNLDNMGNIIISQTDYLKSNTGAQGQTANFIGYDAGNGNMINRAGALISLNDFGSASGPTYNWDLHTLENNGTLQFCGRGDTGGSTYQLYCDQTCYNYGVIDFEQYTSNTGASFFGSNDTQNFYNEGAFRLVNVVHHNVQDIYGSGCWVIDEGAVLYLEDGTGRPQNTNDAPFQNQKIYFTNASQSVGRLQTIHLDPAVYAGNSNFGPEIYGYGSGKAIEFYEVIRSFSYSSGVLTVVFDSDQVNLKLGPNYDPARFYQARNSQNYNSAGKSNKSPCTILQ